MIQRIWNKLKFHLERLALRGAHYRLLVIAALIGLISAGAGLLVIAVTTDFSSAGEGMWWAFLRLTDPGYLGDDRGFKLRVISTAVTVLGYVLFMGSLIAILTQWLSQTHCGLRLAGVKGRGRCPDHSRASAPAGAAGRQRKETRSSPGVAGS